MGLQYISASLERLILFVYPTLTLLRGVLFLGKKALGASWERCCCRTWALAWRLRTICTLQVTHARC